MPSGVVARDSTNHPVRNNGARRDLLAKFHAPPPGNENEPGGGGSERDAPPS